MQHKTQRPVQVCWVEAQFLNLTFKDARVLPDTQMLRIVYATREEKILRPQSRLLDRFLYGS